MRKVIVESPFAGKTPDDLALNAEYLSACLRDCIMRDESPYASHALLTRAGVLTTSPTERTLGIRAGFEWRASADATVVYVDRGMSRGMRAGVAHALEMPRRLVIDGVTMDLAPAPHEIEYRSLGGSWMPQPRRIANEIFLCVMAGMFEVIDGQGIIVEAFRMAPGDTHEHPIGQRMQRVTP